MNLVLTDVLTPYQTAINQAIRTQSDRLGPPSPVKDACQYALETSGKRFRPALVLMMAEALGSTQDVTEAALAVEYFHTASLIADDLPCMDNDSVRRDAPATHIQFNEATALLASYALIAAGYEAIARQAGSKPHLAALAIQVVCKNTGLAGATGGQYFDLYPERNDAAELEQIMIMKTVSLFEISFVLGWLFGEGDPSRLEEVKMLAHHFGIAFQIADDIDDWDQDQINLAKLLGIDQAKQKLKQHVMAFFQGMNALQLEPLQFYRLAQVLDK